MPFLPALRFACLLALLAAASCCDLRRGRIPNLLNLAGFVLALSLALMELQTGSAERAGNLFLGMFIAGGTTLLFYLGGGMGGGDVKLAPAFGLLSGYPEVINYLFYGCLAGLALVLGRLTWRGELLHACKLMLGRRLRVFDPGRAQREAAVAGRPRASVAFPLALFLGVAWVWLMRWL